MTGQRKDSDPAKMQINEPLHQLTAMTQNQLQILTVTVTQSGYIDSFVPKRVFLCWKSTDMATIAWFPITVTVVTDKACISSSFEERGWQQCQEAAVTTQAVTLYNGAILYSLRGDCLLIASSSSCSRCRPSGGPTRASSPPPAAVGSTDPSSASTRSGLVRLQSEGSSAVIRYYTVFQ